MYIPSRYIILATVILQCVGVLAWPAVTHASQLPIISAVQTTGGSGHTTEDFIELFNPTDAAFNLKGHRLVKRTASGVVDSLIVSWSEDMFIPPYSFYLWANSNYATIAATPNSTSAATIADNNGIALRFGSSDTGTIIDSLAWGTVTNGFEVGGTNLGPYESLSRTSLFDGSHQFIAQASQPRNASVQQLPPDPTEPLPVDDAVCLTQPASITATPGSVQVQELQFQNTGTSTWREGLYVLQSTAISQSIPVPLTTPQGNASFSLQLTAPSDLGEYHYSFSIANQTASFGMPCKVTLAVISPPQEEEPPSSQISLVRINELLPNPEGEDSGNEKIEIFNYSTDPVNLKNWIIDDIAETDPISSNKYVLPEMIIQPSAYSVITIPKGKFALNNTSGDMVTLFNDQQRSVSTAVYSEDALEGLGYAYFATGWQWTDLSLGQENNIPVSESEVEPDTIIPEVILSEIYPYPNTGSKEFIELYNQGEAISLDKLALQIGEQIKVLPALTIPAHSFLIVDAEDISLQLRNSGQIITLMSTSGVSIDTVEYPQAKIGQSYIRLEDGWLWTTSITPASANQFIAPVLVSTGKVPVVPSVKSTTKKTTTKVATKKSSAATKAKQVVAATKLNGISSSIVNKNIPSESSEEANQLMAEPTKQKDFSNQLPLIFLGVVTIGIGLFIVYKYVFSSSVEI